MGNVIARKLSDGRVTYHVRYVEIGRLRVSYKVKAKSEEEAQAWLDKAEERVAAGLPGIVKPRRVKATPVSKKITVRELAKKFVGFADGFTTGHGAETKNPEKYRRGVWSVLKTHVLPHLGEMTVDAVQRTVQKALRIASKMGPRQRSRPASARRHRFLPRREKGELAALKWSQIDRQGQRVQIHESWDENARKSGKPVTPTMHPHLVAIFQAWREKTGGQGDGLVFPDPMTAKMRPEYNNRAVLKKTGKKTALWGLDAAIVGAGVRAFSHPWHWFRHSHGTKLATLGATALDIKASLGQSTTEAAQNYIHTTAASAKKFVEQMPTIGPVASLDAARRRLGNPRQPRENGADSDDNRTMLSSRK
jgi:integrase